MREDVWQTGKKKEKNQTKNNRHAAKKRDHTKTNLNLILWFAFSMFSLLIIVAFAIVQNVLISRELREQMQENLLAAGKELTYMFNSDEFAGVSDASRTMLAYANEYGVSAYLFTADGNYIYPEIMVDDREKFYEIFLVVEEKLSAVESDYAVIFQLSESEYAFASSVTLQGGTHYLYLSSSIETFSNFAAAMRWFSIIMALFTIAIAFLLSGFVSMIITKPLCEVTERAKELAKGNYDVKFDGDYDCTEVAELSDALNYASSEISKADKMQKELIANVSHDFKTPLTMIKAYAAMIQEISGDDPEKRQKHTQIIIDEADRLTVLVKDLLDLSKMQAGIDSFEQTTFNLSEDVYGVVNRFSYLSETQGYRIETDVEDDLYTFASKSRVEQVLYNLIGNAVNYTGDDKKVVVRLKSRGDVSRFEVIDSGKGIAPDEIDTIWERYYRSTASHKRPIQGTGLGLSIVKTILKKHNINFGVTSKLGEGSCFWVDFPIPPEVAAEERKETQMENKKENKEKRDGGTKG